MYTDEKINRYNFLYDFYGELLTEKQKEFFELYYLNDLSLNEISEMKNIKRQSVHSSIKRCEEKLDDFEVKLHLLKNYKNNAKQISIIIELLEDMNNPNSKKIKRCLGGIV
ncbi:MAG: YlxM family DNA-binding protein [Lachnospirales bacterium]